MRGGSSSPDCRTAGSPSSASEDQARERGWDVVRPRAAIMPAREHRGQVGRENGRDQDSTKTLQHQRAHNEKERCGVGTLPPPLRLIDAISCLVLFGSAILI